MHPNKTRYSIYNLNYHFVFIPKYRKKILINQVRLRLSEILREACIRHSISVLALEIMFDHVHIFVSAPPRISPSEIINIVKGYSSRKMRQIFPHLKKLIKNELWTRTYFVGSAGTVSAETIKKYIAEQKKIC